VGIGAALVPGVPLVAPPLDLGFPSDAFADFAQLDERLGIDLIDLLMTESVDARMAERVVALVARTRTALALAAGRDEGDAPGRRFKIAWRARFGEMAARARMNDSGFIEVAHGVEYALHAIVVGVAAASSDNIDPKPFQVFQQRRLGGHVAAALEALLMGV